VSPAGVQGDPNPPAQPEPGEAVHPAQGGQQAPSPEAEEPGGEPQTLRDAIEQQADPASALRREAAARRRQLREVEAERDAIREERDALRAQGRRP